MKFREIMLPDVAVIRKLTVYGRAHNSFNITTNNVKCIANLIQNSCASRLITIQEAKEIVYHYVKSDIEPKWNNQIVFNFVELCFDCIPPYLEVNIHQRAKMREEQLFNDKQKAIAEHQRKQESLDKTEDDMLEMINNPIIEKLLQRDSDLDF